MVPRILLALFFLGCFWLETRSKSPRAPSVPVSGSHQVRQSLPDRLLMTAFERGGRSALEKAERPGSPR